MFFTITSYLRYYLNAKTKFEVHSPFVFDFVNEILEDDRQYYAFEQVKRIYQNLLHNDRIIEVTDLGAGSKHTKGTSRKISKIAKTAVSPLPKGQLLFRIINFYKPEKLLELGTSFGISTLLQSTTSSKSQMITIEGCPEIAKVANNHFSKFPKTEIKLRIGDFASQLSKAIAELGHLDYVYFDGNHKKEPTLNYFHTCLNASHENSIFIFDDIHWSQDMEKAWAEIKNHPSVTLSIDLYSIGLIFFRTSFKSKQHYALIKSWKKPWKMGFFGSNIPQ
ncbi:MAG: class I SAM-dependent methyltransferase [Bacteroidota bacterium]